MTTPLPESAAAEPKIGWPAGLLLLLWLALGALPVSDSDALMHANIGRWMVEHRALLPTPDPFVWTDAGADHQHEWAAQWLIGALVSGFGLHGLRIFGASLALACGLLVLAALRRAGARPAAAAAALGAWMVLVQPHLAPRPHLIGWALAIAVLGLGFADPKPWRGRRLLGWAAVLVIWANFHSSVLIAPIYAGLHFAEQLWRRWRSGSTLVDREALLRLGVAAGATLLQPLGPGLLGYVLRSQAIGAWSDEWLPLFAADVGRQRPAVWLVFAAVTLAVVAAAVRGRRAPAEADAPAPPIDLTFPGIWPAVFSLAHGAYTRRMTVFVLLALLWLVRRLPSLGRWREVPQGRWAWFAAALTALAIGPDVALLAQPGPLQSGAFPQLSTAFLKASGLRGRLFNPDPWGSYLSWQLGPGQKVFLDGRILLSGPQVVADVVALQARPPGVDKVFARYNLDLLIQRTADFRQVPPPDPQQWRLAWWDRQAVVLVRFSGPSGYENRQRLCQFYRDRPAAQAQARLPDGWGSRARLEAALDQCPP